MPEHCLRVVDLETVGFLAEQPDEIRQDPARGICEVGWTDVLVNVGDKGIIGVEVDGGFGSVLYRPPGGIPPEASAIHHLLDRDVAAFNPADKGALSLLVNSPPWRGPEKPFALVAHNASFETEWLSPYLPADAKWICTMKVACQLWPDFKSHANQALKYKLGIDLPEALCHPPHRAGPDAFVTAHILARMLQETSVSQMVLWTRMPRLMTKCPIGDQWRGKPWAEVDAGFLRWMVDKPIDDKDAIHWAREELERRAKLARQPDLASEDY